MHNAVAFLLFSAELFDFGITGDLRDNPEFGGMMGRARPKQDADQENTLMLTLEEVYRGCTKKAKVNKMVCTLLVSHMSLQSCTWKDVRS